MRILVAGATGAVGLELVPQLIAAGHSVVGTTRTAAKAEIIRRMGAEPAIADGLDAPAIREPLGFQRGVLGRVFIGGLITGTQSRPIPHVVGRQA